MGKRSANGFTIIETILFIAISGVLVVALLVGTGMALGVQRYRDSVQSFKSLIQEQYSEVINVKNDRGDNWECNSDVITEEGPVSPEKTRGQSDCVIIGKYIQIEDGNYTSHSVLARESATSVNPSDIGKLKDKYTLELSTVYSDSGSLEWSTTIDWASEGDDSNSQDQSGRAIAILIVRSPDSGQIYTFTSDNLAQEVDNNALKAMIVEGDSVPGQAARTICVNPNGILITERIALYINAYAGAASAIETRSNSVQQALGSNSRC